jgi:hypothetical protein
MHPGRFHSGGSRKALLAFAAFAGFAMVIGGCDSPMDLNSLPQQQSTLQDTAYVQIDPPFGGFNGPEGLLMGRDQLLYIADTRANRIVMLNRAGTELSARSIIHPRCIAQDSRLDLLVGAEIVAVSGDTIGAILRLHLVSLSADSAHHLEVSPIDTVWTEPAHPQRRFPGLTVLPGNSYLAVRSGTDNSSFIDPDARVLQFGADDRFITPLSAFSSGVGTGIVNINMPTSIIAFPGSSDFILTQTSTGVAYGAIWMAYQNNADFIGWLPKFDPANAADRSVDFIRPNRFISAHAAAVDPSRRDVFIADAGQDSVFKFNSRGVFKAESFGRGQTKGQLRRPTGLAFFSSVLYVLDGDLGVIFRYRLSTDVPR